MKSLSRIFCAVALVCCICATANASSIGKLTAKIVDENGASIQGASVYLSFSAAKQGDGGGLTSSGKEGLSDKDGLFSGSEFTLPYVGVVADKDGYYRSIQKYEFKSSTLLLNRWEPWNPTIEVVLKKKRNPVPIVVNGGIIKLPNLDSPVGYDLVKGDWVAPYGTGATSDFIFTFHAVSRAYTDYECSFTLTFSNEDDGIQEYYFDEKNQSSYRWPFMAPEFGYLPKLYREKSDSPQNNFKSTEKERASYIYRVRTQKDKDGNIVAAMYGKISKEFEFGPNGTILFGYDLNHDGTRNLEEDPNKNLFKKK